MTRTLYLLRHAKSAWGDVGLADIDRPLANRGWEGAKAAGAYLAHTGALPDRILCSVARRARETLAGLLPHLDRELDVALTRRIYNADPDGLLTLVRGQPDSAGLLLIGHNPAVEDLAFALVGGGDPAALGRMRHKYPTAGLATIAFAAGSWSEISAGQGNLTDFWTPGRNE